MMSACSEPGPQLSASPSPSHRFLPASSETWAHRNGHTCHPETRSPVRSHRDRERGSRPGSLPLLRVPEMSLKMVCANFRNPSLHLVEQPLMVAEGRQARLSAPRREGCHLACSWTSEPAWANPESWTHPRRSGNKYSFLCSESGFCIHGACRARCSLPSPSSPPPLLPAVHSSPTHGRSSACQRRDSPARAQGALRTREESGAERSREGGAEARPGFAVFLSYMAVATEQLILSPKGGDRCPETLISSCSQLPGWLSRSFLPGEADQSILLRALIGIRENSPQSRKLLLGTWWKVRSQPLSGLVCITEKSDGVQSFLGGVGGWSVQLPRQRHGLPPASDPLPASAPGAPTHPTRSQLRSGSPHPPAPCRAGEGLCVLVSTREYD